MAEFYLDISAVGAEYQAYAATPTWGAGATDKPLPMDGNGKAGPGHSAAVAIAEIQITVLPADGNTLVIAGATLTAKTTAAAKNQWTLGATIATCVSNLVAMLNTFGTGTAQCDAATNSGTSALLLALPYWQFARVKPGTTDTLQIATRIAGADLNHASNSNVAISSSGWATPPTITQFAGGANGPFGYLMNGAAVFGVAIGLWGVLTSTKAGAPTDPGASTDLIHARTKRSSVDLSASVSNGSTTTSVTGPSSSYRSVLFDNGTIWSGDNGTLTLACTGSSGNWNLRPGTSGTLRIAARAKYGLKVTFNSNSTSFVMTVARDAATTDLKNIWLSAVNANSQFKYASGNPSLLLNIHGCKISQLSAGSFCTVSNSDTSSVYKIADSIIEYSGIGANVTGLHAVSVAPPNSASITMISYVNCAFVVDNYVYSVTSPISGGSNWLTNCSLIVSFENCRGLSNPSAGVVAGLTAPCGYFLWDDGGSDRQFRYECNNYTIDWLGASVHPYYNATLASGVGASHRISRETTRLVATRPLRVGRYASFFRGAAGSKTLALELLVPSGEIPTGAQVWMNLKYTSGGVLKYESTMEPYSLHEAGLATSLPAGVGTGSWTLNGLASVSSRKLTITTTNSVDQNTEIVADLWLCGPPLANGSIYVSPDLVIS